MRKLSLTSLVLLLYTMAFAQWGAEQIDENSSARDRLFVGGGLGGFSISRYSDYFGFNGMVGYNITPKLAGGVQFQYRFTNYKQITPTLKTNDYGVGPFLRFNFYRQLFLHTEYEYLSYETLTTRRAFSSFMAGGGFFQPIGRKASFFLMGLYNFSYVEANQRGDISPYNSPFVIRAGVTSRF